MRREYYFTSNFCSQTVLVTKKIYEFKMQLRILNVKSTLILTFNEGLNFNYFNYQFIKYILSFLL